ncbi:hypothetical protein [Moraxella marmotae]|uniref:hypothetical protein n=1 Tax=Moraxella marmotae TaxID=3344520 RepID=UPI0035F2B363
MAKTLKKSSQKTATNIAWLAVLYSVDFMVLPIYQLVKCIDVLVDKFKAFKS